MLYRLIKMRTKTNVIKCTSIGTGSPNMYEKLDDENVDMEKESGEGGMNVRRV